MSSDIYLIYIFEDNCGELRLLEISAFSCPTETTQMKQERFAR